MKSNTNITLDSDVLAELREKNINRSQTINKLLKAFLGIPDLDKELEIGDLQKIVDKKEMALMKAKEDLQKKTDERNKKIEKGEIFTL